MTGSGGFALSYNYATGTTGYIGGLYYAPSHQQFVLFSNASGSQFSNLDNVTFNPSNFASLNLGNLYSNTVSLVSNSGTGSISQTGSNGVYIPDLVVNNITGTNGFFQNMSFQDITNVNILGVLSGITGYFEDTLIAPSFTGNSGYFNSITTSNEIVGRNHWFKWLFFHHYRN